MNVSLFRKIYGLCEEYKKTNCLTPTEFVNGRTSNLEEDTVFHFLNLQRHNPILQEIAEHFIKFHDITINLNITRIKLLFYILISAFDPGDITGIEQIFTITSKISYVKNILLYYSDEENQIITARIACKYFDNDYVINNFVEPIMTNKELYEEIYDILNEKEYKRFHKKLTVPIEMNVSKKSIKIPAVPLNTPAELAPFRSSRIPRSTYEADIKLQKKLKEEHEKNRERALQLLEQAKTMPDYQKPVKLKTTATEEVKVLAVKRPKRIIVKKDVPIRGNLTTVMREAALYAKEKEACINEINEILKGGVNTKLTKTFENEMREIEEQRQLEEIEKKRLKCLLSYEDAIIAKCKLKEMNKKKMFEMLEERETLMKQLNEWKAQEREKYRMYVQKAQESNRNAKESEKKMMEEKQCNARLVQWESKMLLSKAMEEKEKELARRMHIIQEIKAINQVRAIDVTKEFDRTECPNLGLLCEMSIAELEERLHLMKVKMSEDLDEKRKCILKNKEEKQRMIEDAKTFIEQNRTVKHKAEIRPTVKLKESPDIQDLKKKLADAKRMRKVCTMCPCRPCPLLLNYGKDK